VALNRAGLMFIEAMAAPGGECRSRDYGVLIDAHTWAKVESAGLALRHRSEVFAKSWAGGGRRAGGVPICRVCGEQCGQALFGSAAAPCRCPLAGICGP